MNEGMRYLRNLQSSLTLPQLGSQPYTALAAFEVRGGGGLLNLQVSKVTWPWLAADGWETILNYVSQSKCSMSSNKQDWPLAGWPQRHFFPGVLVNTMKTNIYGDINKGCLKGSQKILFSSRTMFNYRVYSRDFLTIKMGIRVTYVFTITDHRKPGSYTGRWSSRGFTKINLEGSQQLWGETQ